MKFNTRHILIFLIVLVAAWPFAGCNGGGGTDRVESGSSGYPKAPDSILNTEITLTDDSTIRIADMKGKVVLVNLWATWCGPCRNEIPELAKLQEEYKDRDFEVLGLDVDPEPLEMIKPFAEEMGINYKLGWAEEELTRAFFRINEDRNGIPQSFLINRNGELTGVFFGGGGNVIEMMKKTVAEVVESK